MHRGRCSRAPIVVCDCAGIMVPWLLDGDAVHPCISNDPDFSIQPLQYPAAVPQSHIPGATTRSCISGNLIFFHWICFRSWTILSPTPRSGSSEPSLHLWCRTTASRRSGGEGVRFTDDTGKNPHGDLRKNRVKGFVLTGASYSVSAKKGDITIWRLPVG
ncbi:hypothetical protein BC826DRAFT_566616 [Russula brevipes]|nr:hypothetical protein BC826DRAFT_566616 [Russula brevipes]